MTGEPSGQEPAGLGPIAAAVGNGSVSDIELAWADHLGHTLGKRLPAASFLQRAAAAERERAWLFDNLSDHNPARELREAGVFLSFSAVTL